MRSSVQRAKFEIVICSFLFLSLDGLFMSDVDNLKKEEELIQAGNNNV